MNSAPPTEGVPTPPVVKIAAEAGGYVLSCVCGWVRWFDSTRNSADIGALAHAAKCKGAPSKVETSPKAGPRSRTSWNDREGATWIDKL